MEHYSLAMFTRNGGWRLEEIQVLLAKVRSEILSNKSHLYTKWWVSTNIGGCQMCSFVTQYFHHGTEAKLDNARSMTELKSTI